MLMFLNHGLGYYGVSLSFSLCCLFWIDIKDGRPSEGEELKSSLIIGDAMTDGYRPGYDWGRVLLVDPEI